MSLKKGEEGRILWNKTFTPPSSAGGLTISMGQVDPEDGAFFFECAQTRERWAYSMETMQQLWKSQPESQWNFYGMSEDIYEGKLITWGYGGELLAYNITTGKIVWNYTSLPVGLESWYGNTPISGALFCDDKIYIFSTEHSPSMPYRRDALIRCIDANTGKQLWNVTHWAINLAISDGYLVALNYYDNSVYCYGKGPSATTVTADPKVSVLGTKVLVEGTVTDQSPGGRQDSSGKLIVPLKGTPAIADEYMTPWMEYLFAQRPKPTDAKGVEVTIYVLDPNNNYYEVGKTTSDITGRFACDFTPEVPGKYQIIAKFDGSKSYGPSMATTYITVDETPPQSPSPTPATESLADTYFVPAVASILVAIIIVGAVTALLLLRKRP
ncbi:MAG: PQQ-binding-like beta-propeller repeat protein [Candidatus Bathyarchaeota archaeon]|nr:PQQ-binding-like beta-propeller repeat protein [Candidatus Bathyarchaeota archaeon]